MEDQEMKTNTASALTAVPPPASCSAWKPIDWDECSRCGRSPILAFTDARDDLVGDGDSAKCPNCGQLGGCSVDDTGAWISWDDQNF